MPKNAFTPSMMELCRIAESRIYTALVINRRTPREYEMEVRNERHNIWRDGTTTKDDVRASVLSITLDFLAGHRVYNQGSGPSIGELALSQLDRDMISDSQGEGAWEGHYQQRHARLVKAGGEDSEEAEKLMIMFETLKVYRERGVFANDEYSPSKAGDSDGRDKRQRFFGADIS